MLTVTGVDGSTASASWWNVGATCRNIQISADWLNNAAALLDS